MGFSANLFDSTFISVNSHILDRKELTERQSESEQRNIPSFRRRVGKAVLMTGVSLIASLVILGVCVSFVVDDLLMGTTQKELTKIKGIKRKTAKKIKTEIEQKNEWKPVEIEEIVKAIDWQEFERLVSEILEKHEFKTWNNFRFKTKRRYEIDVITTRNNTTFLIDCKQWSTGRYKSSALKRASEDQEERLEEFERFVEENADVKKVLKEKGCEGLVRTTPELEKIVESKGGI